MNPLSLQGRTDHAVQAGVFGVLRVGQDHPLHGLPDQQLPLQGLLVGGGQLGDGDQQGPGTVGTSQALQGRPHHFGGAGGVEIADVHVQPREDRHGFFHGVGNVVELQIQEDPMAPLLDLPDNGRALGVEELHADLHKGLFPFKAVQKSQGLPGGGEIAGNNNVSSHRKLLFS